MDWRAYDPEPDLDAPLRAALDAFAQNGFHATTVRDVAQRAGLSVPGLYYHYPSKEALLEALLRASIEEVLSRSRAALLEVGDGPVERFSIQIESIVLYMTHRQLLAFLAREIRSLASEQMRSEYICLRDEQERMVEREVCEGVEAGLFTTPYPEDATRAVIAMCRSVAEWYSADGALTAAEIASRYVGFSLATVGYTGPLPKLIG